MSDKFNPYESDHGPSEKPEFSVMIPVSEIVDALRKEKEEHSEDYLKKCPHCLNPVVFYKDNWYFCQQHSFVQIGGFMTPTDNLDFDALTEHGYKCGAYITQGMPSVFEYKNHLVAYDHNEDRFIISTGQGILSMYKGDVLQNDEEGNLSVLQGGT